MRSNLEAHHGKRIPIRGIFDRQGWRTAKDGTNVKTALLQAVEFQDGTHICDHVHIQFAESILNQEPKHGEIIECLCAVVSYKRFLSSTNREGLMQEIDYGLYHPTAVKFPGRAEAPPPPPRPGAVVPDLIPLSAAAPEPEPETEPNLLSISEIAELWGESVNTIHRWVRNNNVPHKGETMRKRMTARLYDPADIEPFRGGKTSKEDEGLYTLPRAAEVLGVHYKTLQGRIWRDRIEPSGTPPGSQLKLYSIAKLKAAMSGERGEAPAAAPTVEPSGPPTKARLVSELSRLVDTYGTEVVEATFAYLKG
jgi:hypothetical protein